MIEIDQVIKEVSKQTGIEQEIVSAVCKHIFAETVNIMKDDDNTLDILFNNLFKFKLKRRYKEQKQQKYSSK